MNGYDLHPTDILRQATENDPTSTPPSQRWKVRVTNLSSEAVPVSLTPQDQINTYAEVSSVASATLTTIVSYTVPIGKIFYLNLAELSGSNIAEVFVTVNNVTIAKKRTYFTDYNAEFLFFGNAQAAGDVVAVKIEHNRALVGDFEARIIGGLVDA